MSGPIPADLFTGVNWNVIRTVISLGGNKLTGTLPANIFGTNFWGADATGTAIVYLDLSSNQLSGAIPDTLLAQDRTISYLSLGLSGNMFSGSIPNFFAHINSSISIARLDIDLRNNQLSGSLALDRIWPPYSLRTSNVNWNLASNSLSGTIPVDLYALAPPNLAEIILDLSSNAFAGTIQPAMIANAPFNRTLIKLSLSLANNRITGPLTAELIGSANQITETFDLDLSSNPLGATIPSNLISAYTGPTSSRNTTKLVLSLNNCGFTGSLPAINATLNEFTLNLNNNSLSALPTLSWNAYLLSGLEAGVTNQLELNVAFNKLTGALSFPSLSVRRPRLNLDLYSNSLSSLSIDGNYLYLYMINVGMNTEMTGTLPKSLFIHGDTYGDGLYGFHANHTSLSGDLPNLSGLDARLVELDLSDNPNINFCPSTLVARWNAYFDICELRNVNVSACIDKYPLLCEFNYERRQASPSDPSNPSSGPIASPTSAASSWTSFTTLLVVSIALVLFITD